MYLTNDIDPIALVTEMLTLDGAGSDTAALRNLSHDADLCPQFRNKLLSALFAYEKHRADVHDVQGFNDRGCDVVLTFDDDEGATRKVGLQIKSHKEIADWWGKSATHGSMTSKLQSQYFEATQKAGVEVWYLVLCADPKSHHAAIRYLTSEFHDCEKAHVIVPERAAAFLRLNDWEIEAFVGRRLCERDLVRIKAQHELERFSPAAARAVLGITCSMLTSGRSISDDEVTAAVIDAAGDDGNPSELLMELDGTVIYEDDGQYHIHDSSTKAIRALYYDHIVRFSASPVTMPERLAILLDI